MSTGTLERRGAGGDQRRRPAIDPRIAARRQEVARDVGKRRRTRLISFAVALGVLAATVGLVRSSLLDVDKVEVASTRHVAAEELIAVSGVQIGDPLAVIDAGDIRSKLLTLPWVADASVSVSWPSALHLAITEREPVATIAVRDGWMLVDAEGRVLGPASVAPSDDANGPVLVEGVSVPAAGDSLDDTGKAALEVVAGLTPGMRTRIDAVIVDSAGQLSLRLRPEGVAFVGTPTDVDRKLEALLTTLAQVDLSCLESVDLQVPGRVDLRRCPPAAPPAGATTPTSTSGTSAATTPSTTSPSREGATSSAG